MKLRYFIIGMLFIILGFIVFTLIGIYNNYTWMNYSIHLQITVAGFILLMLGIVSFYVFIKSDNKKDISKEKEELSEIRL